MLYVDINIIECPLVFHVQKCCLFPPIGVNNNRADPTKPVSEGGDASPVSTSGSLTICEPLSPIDIPPEDNQDSGK